MAADLDDLEEESSSSLSPPLLPPPRSPLNQPELWMRVEEATREIIEQVHPTLVSEDRRRDVILYVQKLIRMTLGCEVHSFGSVPLKTYLPDGDIDLTAFGGLYHEEELAAKVFAVLEREEHNLSSQFVVKDVQLIRAEVKLVKCLVQNIVVDISFNQIGGICTLCFLEKIDHLIGKDHLFKRSIILIKAWCYYESRILGAFHGLISTYALETLVLYIFHLFHSSLNGPLAVLYKFLDYFSKFDWDSYCISLNGPVCLSSLPDIVVETPENGGEDLLLTSEFLKECLEMYSVPSRGFETNPRGFQSKHLNIVDPLKETNNLGRSVSKGNFYRIRSAFTYGARKLGQLFLQSDEAISSELRKFFSNMLLRHGSGQRPDVHDAIPFLRYNRYNAILPASNHFQEGQVVNESESSSSSGATGNGRHDQEDSLDAGVSIPSTTGPDLSGSPGETVPSVSAAANMGRVRTKTVKKASRVIIEKYYNRLTLDFDTNKRVCEEIALIQTKRLRNKIAGFTTHLMKRIQRGPVRGISLKLQEEERERRMDFVPEESALNTDSIEVDRDTMDMLRSINLGSLPGLQVAQVGPSNQGPPGGFKGGFQGRK